jgi:N-methylhydantoinase A
MIIGLDVGGTHADGVLLNDDGLVRELKVPTDPKNVAGTVLAVLERIADGVAPGTIQRLVLSTTLTTNAIAQQEIPPVGMIVSSGPGIDPEYYRTNAHFFPVAGAIDHRGREVAPVDEKEIAGVARTLKKADIRHVGVVGKFSVRNPGHELHIAKVLNPHFERVFTGHRVSGNLNFSRRIATTYLNAAVFSIHRNFYDAVRRSLQEKGLQVPIHILKADGGTMNLDASLSFPGQTILSGPAASVMGALPFAPSDTEAVIMDIGGTTTDIAIIGNGVPLLHPIGVRLGGLHTLIRSVETRSIGCGGDSRVRIRQGCLEIGPERVGPAMAFGGPVPTPTDALFVLGKMSGGDREKSVRGLALLADEMGLALRACAETIFDRTCRRMLDEARFLIDRINNRPVYTIQEIQEGNKIAPQRLLLIGGPAPCFARRLEELSGWSAGVVPHWGVANAIGAALARTTCEVTLFADTQLGTAHAPEEGYREAIGGGFTLEDAVDKAFGLLRRKALASGACADDLAMEVLERQQFNMVRGFLTTGKNIRVKVQVKPGLIHASDVIAEKLAG